MRFVSSMICLAMLLVVAVPDVAHAQVIRERFVEDDAEGGPNLPRMRFRADQQRRFMGQVMMAPVYFLTHVTVHEGGHALAALSYGLEVDRFEPYPHRVSVAEDTNDYGCRSVANRHDFVWGYMHIRFNDEEPSRAQLAMISITPYLIDLVLFTTSDLLLQYVVDPTSAGAPFLLVGGMIAPFVDFAVGMSCFHEGCDISNFSEQSGIPQSVVGLVGYMMVATAFWRIIHQFRRVFMEQRSAESSRAISVTPVANRDSVGVGVAAMF